MTTATARLEEERHDPDTRKQRLSVLRQQVTMRARYDADYLHRLVVACPDAQDPAAAVQLEVTLLDALCEKLRDKIDYVRRHRREEAS